MPLPLRNALIAFGITVAIIATVVYAINYLDRQRLAELTGIQTQLATDTLSLETQFSLLENAPCEDIAGDNQLSEEVSSLGDRLAAAESHLGNTNSQVIDLKKQYTLLQIRDYLLTAQLAKTCHVTPTVVLYFYSNQPGSCADCDRASYNLTYLRQTYPSIRVYSFDYDLDLGALKTLIQLEKVTPQFPAFVINNKRSYGFSTLDDFKTRFPKSALATSTATSTKSTK
jgi:hypothetical protein